MIAKTIGELTAKAPLASTDKVEIESGAASYHATMEQFVPLGTVLMTARSTAPDASWLMCDGSAISRTTYAALFSAIGTAFGVGDNSTTFNIPDMRGAAPAGAGTSSGYTANETIALGTKYNDQMQGHIHNKTGSFTDSSSGANIFKLTGSAAPNQYTDSGGVSVPVSDGTNGTPRTGSVTRGKRVGINFMIKVL